MRRVMERESHFKIVKIVCGTRLNTIIWRVFLKRYAWPPIALQIVSQAIRNNIFLTRCHLPSTRSCR